MRGEAHPLYGKGHAEESIEKMRESHKGKLDIHHIHYDKENCEPDLIALCRFCNSKVNTSRDFYENLFIIKLKKRNLIKV